MKVRHLFEDGRKRLADVKHMPVRRVLIDDEVTPNMARGFVLVRDAEGKPLYMEFGKPRPVLDVEVKPRAPVEAPPPASE